MHAVELHLLVVALDLVLSMRNTSNRVAGLACTWQLIECMQHAEDSAPLLAVSSLELTVAFIQSQRQTLLYHCT